MLFERKKGYMPSCRIQLCVRKKYPANFPALGRGPCLDERKGGKRKSRHQGCLPSLPDTLKETKRGRGDCPGTSNETERFVLSCGRQSCVRKKYPANCSALDFGLFLDVRDESSSFSFSFLDERKGGKRKSRRQGRLPNCPGTSKIFDLPLPVNMKTQHVCGMSPPGTPQTKQPDTFTHAGLHSHSDGRAVHSQK